jgi:hypothetical protein
MARKLTRNPNIGKRHLPISRSQVRATTPRRKREPVKVSYLPGKTIASRIAGIQEHYDRAARVAQIGA